MLPPKSLLPRLNHFPPKIARFLEVSNLRSAYIKDFLEILPNPLRGFKPIGEIAIVVNVFETSTGNELKLYKYG